MARVKVTHRTFEESLEAVGSKGVFIAIDTETTGLEAYKKDKIFSIILSNEEDDYYFNFNATLDHTGQAIPYEYILPKSWLDKFKVIFENDNYNWFIQNAKFDLHFLAKEGLYIKGNVYCTQTLSRLVNNRLNSYSLSNLGELIGHKKDDAVEAYITKNKLYTDVDVGKKKPKRLKHFDLVPFNIISEYGLTDGRVCYELGKYCLERLGSINKEQRDNGLPLVSNVVAIERDLTKALFNSEKRGVRIDKEYCEKALAYELDLYNEACAKFEALTGIEYQDSRTVLKKAFEEAGLPYGTTPKGNASFKDELLPDNELGDLIRLARAAYKRANTYFKNFIELADEDGVIHCSFLQAGTITGRMSCINPNLQNVPKRGEDDAAYPVRKAFIPRPGHFFVMVDFDQMEYRLLLDIAGEEEVIRQINEDGLDVHTATANAMGTNRTAAKTLNFLLLYGGGAQKLADALDITLNEAKQLKSMYFRNLKKVKGLTKALTDIAKWRGYIVNWAGRKLMLDELAPYRMPNHYIQGGCGDICKAAMVEIHNLLKKYESTMLLQVHDELIIEVKYGEEEVIPKIKEIMQTVYPQNSLPLTAGVDYSSTNWFDKGVYNG
jgi:DNA polymerase-1